MPDRDRPRHPSRSSEPPQRGRDRPSAAWARKRNSPQGGQERGRGRPSAARDGDGPAILYGWHTVTAALANPERRFRRLMLSENAARRLDEAGIALPVPPDIVRPEKIDGLLGPDAVHQGLYAEADPLPSPDVTELDPHGIILVLDQITDPHNVGAIFRSAAAFDVGAIVTTARHSPEATGVLAKAASGAIDYVPLVTVGNLARALTTLKEHGWQVVGLDSAGDGDLVEQDLVAPLALVLGAEGKGLRQLTRATCDRVARLDLPGRIKSLNVSNATVLALYIARTRLAKA